MSLQLKDDTRAKALLELVEGSVSVGIVSVIESYGYMADGTDAQTFWIGDLGEDVGLKFSRDWTSVLILGDALENIENANYILNRGGWDTAKATVANLDVEEVILGNFASVTITDIVRAWDNDSSGGKSAQPAAATSISQAQQPAPIEQQPASADPTPAPDAHCTHVAEVAQAVERQHSPTPAASAGTSIRGSLSAERRSNATATPCLEGGDKLIPILETLMLTQLEHAFAANSLVKQLDDAGYEVTVRITRRAA